MLSGYSVSRFEELAQPLDGPAVSKIQAEAIRLGVHIGFGLPLVHEAGIANGYVICGGETPKAFGKFHRWWHGDWKFTPWRKVELVDVRGFAVAVMICFDGRFPEAARALALAGADLIAWPASWPAPPKSNPEFLGIIGRARSFENQCYVALANRFGDAPAEEATYAGRSTLFGPTGEVISTADEREQILYCELDREKLEQVRTRYDIYSERDPDFYSLHLDRQAPPGRLKAER
jgi:predicted amidohydrolase